MARMIIHVMAARLVSVVRGRGRLRERTEPEAPGPAPDGDRYLTSLSALLSEWDSPEDAEAYDRL